MNNSQKLRLIKNFLFYISFSLITFDRRCTVLIFCATRALILGLKKLAKTSAKIYEKKQKKQNFHVEEIFPVEDFEKNSEETFAGRKLSWLRF